MFTQYLTGSSNDYTREAAETDLYGKLGLLIQPKTWQYTEHLPSYHAFGIDNGCFSTGGQFDGEDFLRKIDHLVQNVEDAYQKCLFATAPDVFDPVAMKGDPVATLERSRPFFSRLRDAGVPAALVAQDGLEDMIDDVPWNDFDVLFLGGSDEFKLGYPAQVRQAGKSSFYGYDALTHRSRQWAKLIYAAHANGKGIHVGRVNANLRLCFANEIDAESADGTMIARSGRKGLELLRRWYSDDRLELRVDDMSVDQHLQAAG